MIRRLGTRTFLASALLAIVVSAALVSLALEVRTLRDEARAERDSGQVLVAATSLDERREEMVAAVNGYLVSHRAAALREWRTARPSLAAAAGELVSLTAGGSDAASARALVAAVQGLERSWAAPLMSLAVRDLAAARALARRLDRSGALATVRARSDSFIAAASSETTTRTKSVNHTASLAVTFLTVRLVGSLVIVGMFVFYLIRRVIRPVRRVGVAAERLAGGEPGVRVPETGSEEVAKLGRSFNAMADAIERQRTELEAQNTDLGRLATVLRAVLDSTVDGILLTSPDGEVQLANRPMLRLGEEIGLPADGTAIERLEAIRDKVRDPERYAATVARLAAQPDEPSADEFELVDPDRSLIGYTAPVRDDAGARVGRIWTFREVTHERQLERMKDDFVASVSHELRTPLTSMMGFIEIVRDGAAGPLTSEQERFLSIVYRSSQRLQRLVGDLLFVAQLDATGMKLDLTDVPLDELLRGSVEAASGLAGAQGIDLRYEAPPNAITVTGDAERLDQLAGNLISNGLKFTPPGGTVTVRSYLDDGRAVIEVADTGAGVPAGEEERIFERFYRSPAAVEKAIPGTGLGLVITRAIAEAHDGRVAVVPGNGSGARFRVELPLAHTQNRAA
jgi:signal transduction histidine kinase/HAMP domain-containing protein